LILSDVDDDCKILAPEVKFQSSKRAPPNCLIIVSIEHANL